MEKQAGTETSKWDEGVLTGIWTQKPSVRPKGGFLIPYHALMLDVSENAV